MAGRSAAGKGWGRARRRTEERERDRGDRRPVAGSQMTHAARSAAREALAGMGQRSASGRREGGNAPAGSTWSTRQHGRLESSVAAEAPVAGDAPLRRHPQERSERAVEPAPRGLPGPRRYIPREETSAAPESARSGDGPQRIWPALGSWREALAAPRTSTPDYWLLATVGALVIIGLVMLYSSSFAIAAEKYGSPMFFLGKQLLWVVIGAVGALITMRLDYRFWRRYSVVGMAVVIVLLIAVRVLPAPLSEEINGAKRWITLGPISIQPSQLGYLVFAVYIADWLSKRGQKLRQVAYGLVPFATIMGVLAGLIMLEPDMGTAVVLVLVGAIVFVVAGADLKQIALAGVLSGGIFFLFARFSPYRWARISAFVDPWSAPSDVGYHLIHNLMALGSGGFFGVGLGQGLQKFQWLPSPHTDSIFAVIGEELGLLGCLLFVGLFLWIAYRGFTISLRAPDRYGLLLGVGLTTWLSFQGLLNMGVVAGLLPFTGLTLPFVSYGGSSLACCMAATGLLINLSCHARKREDARADLGRGHWWSRLSRLGRGLRPAAKE